MRLFRDLSFRRKLYQIALAAVVVGAAWYLISTTAENLQRRNLASGFSYLLLPANFDLGEGLLPFSSTSSYGWAMVVGVSNTIKVAVIGCVLATILGTLVGIMRLLANPILAGISRVYVDFLRNVPLLLHVLFWYAVIVSLPPPRQALALLPGVVLSNRGLIVPTFAGVDEPLALFSIAAFVVLATALAIFARRGGRRGIVLCGTGAFACLVAAVAQLRIEEPVLRGFNFIGGWTLSVEFTTILLSLSLYASAFVAEIVRAGITAVPKGQSEAGRALGLREWQITLLVVLPQSLRLAIPPMTNQYLNITKNSSLGIAIGYPELVTVSNTIINRTGQALETIAVLMAVYLSLSLATSALMNWFNRRTAVAS